MKQATGISAGGLSYGLFEEVSGESDLNQNVTARRIACDQPGVADPVGIESFSDV